VNRLLNGALIEKALSLPIKARRNLLDLYCGCGFFTLPFSAIVEKAVGIERDPGSYRSGMAAKRLNATGNVTFRNEIVEKEIFRVREADLVIVDPPRSGMPAAAMKGLVKLRPEEIIMISCEPPTFSRDAAKLIEAGYSLSSVHVLDMFPGTYHVETLGHFLRS
jgi:23S rRNA (uracil1939-C5)-methyltransferase